MNITEFEVDSSGTLTVADFWEPKTRSDFYESVSDSWSESPAHLADAMEECQPLAWAVHSIYTELRDEIQADLDGITRDWGVYKKRALALQARIEAMPEEPHDNAEDWLLTLTSSEFEAQVVPEIEKWFDSPPNWGWEDDHLPKNGTAQGAALQFFQSMDGATLDILGWKSSKESIRVAVTTLQNSPEISIWQTKPPQRQVSPCALRRDRGKPVKRLFLLRACHLRAVRGATLSGNEHP